MDKNENVFIKLQIEKNYTSGDLILVLNFDKNAPNLSMDGDVIRWSPTFEELDLVVETYAITSKKKNRVEMSDEEVKNATPFSPSDNKTKESPSDDSSERKIVAFEPLEGDIGFKESTSESVLDKKGEDGEIFVQDDREPSEPVLDRKDDESEIFVQVDEKTIDEALKRKSVDVKEALILDEDDKSIIDKMLKKRGKNKDKT